MTTNEIEKKQEIISLDLEIKNMEEKINSFKSDKIMTIHDFSSGKFNNNIGVAAKVLRKEKEHMKRLSFAVNKVITSPVK